MKVLIYSHFFAPSIGGVESIVESLARGIAELRNPQGDAEFRVTLATEIPGGNFDDSAMPFRIVRRPSFFALWRLIQVADVIHLAGPALLPMFFAWMSRKKYIIEHHGYQATCPNGLFLHQPDRSVCPGYFQAAHYSECFKCLKSEFSSRRLATQLLLLMFPRHWLACAAKKNLAVTHHVEQRQKLPRGEVVYHGIADHFSHLTDSMPVVSAKLRIAYVGRLVPEKGVALLLEAVRLLKLEGHDFELRIIGDGPERFQLEEMIEREKLSSCVNFTGFLNGDALGMALRDVSVVVVPSIVEETVGLAAIEQMMRGRVVIAGDIGGLREVVGNTGLKFTPGSATGLADSLRTVITNPSLIGSLGRKARDRALDLFDRRTMIARHAQIYRS